MRKALWGVCLLVMMVWATADGLAQQPNVFYYEKVAENPEYTTYDLTHSTYVPGIFNEPERPGDIVMRPGTWSCNDGPPGQADCVESDDNEHWTQSGGVRTTDRIRVYGVRLPRMARFTAHHTPSQRPMDFFRLIPTDGPVRPQPAETCTGQKIGNMGNLITSAQAQRIANFLNSAAARQLWEDSNYNGPFTAEGAMGRREQAGFLYPNGTFVRANTPDAGPCNTGQINPGPLPNGTIFVHTHPYTRGEPLMHCGNSNPYLNLPGYPDDVADLANNSAVSLGLIIDADGIIVLTENYNPGAPDQAHHKGGNDGKCGVARIRDL